MLLFAPDRDRLSDELDLFDVLFSDVLVSVKGLLPLSVFASESRCGWWVEGAGRGTSSGSAVVFGRFAFRIGKVCCFGREPYSY